MHEMGLCKQILDMVEIHKEGKLKNVKKITLLVGDYASVSLTQLKTSFKYLTLDGEYKDTILEVKRLKGIRYCSYCHQEYDFDFYDDGCPKCHKIGRIIQGTQINIESIEGEEI